VRKIVIITVTVVLSGTVCPVLRAAPTDDDKRVDLATDKALEYLARTQNPDGSWDADTRGKNSGVASMAVMAFMAKGHTPDEGPYGDIINRGIDYVVSTCDPRTGFIAPRGQGQMYGHGASTLMLAEAVGMTSGERGTKIRAALERAVKLILKAQAIPRKSAAQQGGWRYSPSSEDSDLSVTGWQLLALRAAKNAGADVPVSAIDEAVAYVKRSKAKGGGFGYQPGGGTNHARSGIGILSLEICGRHHEPEALEAADWLMRSPPRWGNDGQFYYAVYYCSQGMFQMGGKYWEFYRPRLEALLLSLQKEDGSWPVAGARAGPVYPTAMSVMALSVKYHYLPIYQR